MKSLNTINQDVRHYIEVCDDMSKWNEVLYPMTWNNFKPTDYLSQELINDLANGGDEYLDNIDIAYQDIQDEFHDDFN